MGDAMKKANEHIDKLRDEHINLFSDDAIYKVYNTKS